MIKTKAYKNKKGYILAVFKDDSGDYGVYKREREKGPFNSYKTPYPHRATRSEAEMDLAATVYRSTDKSWEEIEFKG